MAPALDTNIPALTLVALLAALAAKHYAADFVLQNSWMARGKERPRGWGRPLAAHAGVQALGTLLVVLPFRPGLWWLALIDFAVHGAIDRGKALVAQRTRFTVNDARFWWLFGLDQFLHQLTNIALSAWLVLA